MITRYLNKKSILYVEIEEFNGLYDVKVFMKNDNIFNLTNITSLDKDMFVSKLNENSNFIKVEYD